MSCPFREGAMNSDLKPGDKVTWFPSPATSRGGAPVEAEYLGGNKLNSASENGKVKIRLPSGVIKCVSPDNLQKRVPPRL